MISFPSLSTRKIGLGEGVLLAGLVVLHAAFLSVQDSRDLIQVNDLDRNARTFLLRCLLGAGEVLRS
jgi:hypothetical protein